MDLRSRRRKQIADEAKVCAVVMAAAARERAAERTALHDAFPFAPIAPIASTAAVDVTVVVTVPDTSKGVKHFFFVFLLVIVAVALMVKLAVPMLAVPMLTTEKNLFLLSERYPAEWSSSMSLSDSDGLNVVFLPAEWSPPIYPVVSVFWFYHDLSTTCK
jgi:hypothetical protein